MQNNIIKNLISGISPEVITSLSKLSGGNEGGVKNILSAFTPIIINKTINYLNGSNASVFLKLLENLPSHHALSDFSQGVEGHSESNSIIEKLTSLLFSGNLDGLGGKLAAFSGLPVDVVKKVLFAGSGMLFSAMKGYLSSRSQQSPSLKSWLHEQKKHSDALTPAGFMSQLTHEERSSFYPGIEVVNTQRKKWPWILLVALLALLLLFILRSCGSQPKTQDHTNMWGDLGALISKTLPNGATLQLPEFGMETRLIEFIEGPENKSIWFSFDRLKFKTNSAELQPESDEQMKNIAAILKSYPNIKMQLGGYTDNTGADDYNLKLSQERADSVRQGLIALGAEGNNIDAKGYGSAFPVAPNDTEENRAKNRRIDIRLIK